MFARVSLDSALAVGPCERKAIDEIVSDNARRRRPQERRMVTRGLETRSSLDNVITFECRKGLAYKI